MRTFSLVLKILAPIPIMVGLFHFCIGLRADALLGARIPVEVLSDPVLDSQNRFYGTVFMAYGALLYLCSTNIRAYSSLFQILAGFLILGGIARILSMVANGLPTASIIGLLVIEVVAVPLLLVWHAKVLRSAS